MRKNKTKIISIFITVISIISIGINTYAHSGRTDSNGGHRDNKNKSGLGSYHYHCGGYPAHLHSNGKCPYSSSSSSDKSGTSNSLSSGTKTTKTTTKTKSSNIDVTKIQINEDIGSLEVGESKILTATITPSNATNKNITWKSSDKSIAEISITGELTAKKHGTVDITATSSNGKTSTIKINIKESQKVEDKTIIETSTTNKNNDNTTANKKEESNALDGILVLGLLGGGGYWGYKKYKKQKHNNQRTKK